jgi:spartin
MSSAPEAFLLLTLPNVTLTAQNMVQTGMLALECVTVVVPSAHNPTAQAHASPVNRDVYLVLRLNAFETPIDPARVVVFSVSPAGVRTYTFQGTQLDPRVLTFTIAAKPKGEEDPNLTEDLETFQSIIAQYAELRGGPAPTSAPLPTATHPHDLRGHLVLINEDSGEIIGEVDTDRRFTIQEDTTLAERGREDDPVVLDIPNGAANATESHPLQLFVSFVPPGQEDWITKGATIIR